MPSKQDLEQLVEQLLSSLVLKSEHKISLPEEPPTVSAKTIRLPDRPGYGTMGRKCILRANHFPVKHEDLDIYRYDVSISPEVVSEKARREILKKVVDDCKHSYLMNRLDLAYDGVKSVYAAGSIPFFSEEFVIKFDATDGAGEREFKVSFNSAYDSPQETIQALDGVLRARQSATHTIVGRSFFDISLGSGSLTNGLEYWRGYRQSLQPTQMGLSLNIDTSASEFYESIYVTEYVAKYLNISDPNNLKRPISVLDHTKVEKVLKGVRVEVSCQGIIREYQILGLSDEPVKELMFSADSTGTKMSVVDYFRKKYNISLLYTMLPAIQTGSSEKPVYLPMEVCKIISGQKYTKMLNDRQVFEMLKATCQSPSEREATIKQVMVSNRYYTDEMVREFGIHVQSELTIIEARVLPCPTIKFRGYGDKSLVNPLNGQWNMINKKMVIGGKVKFWTCVNFSQRDPAGFCCKLLQMCCMKGMLFSHYPLVPSRSARAADIEKTLVDIHEEATLKLKSMQLPEGEEHLQLLIVILPDVSGSYGKIKRICETDLGIVSQCCRPKNVSWPKEQYLENIALKINVKVGGKNSVLEQAVDRKIPYLTDLPTIVFGADVTHPQPGEDSSPSIAAVVASMDWPEVSKYRCAVSAQPHRKEIITDLYKMIRELLAEFEKTNNQKPRRIIFYRGGVSNGQFNQVLSEEMDAICKACSSLEEGYIPPVTFVVVQKRHHTRLFPARHDRRVTCQSGNILPGTVVDTDICHPSQFDFYLCSHAGTKGTSRPRRYHVLHDGNGFSADAMQNLTNQLCYTYARCTRSVSTVPPVYYARLAARRARLYIDGDIQESGSTSGAGEATGDNKAAGKATRDKKTAKIKPLLAIKDNVKQVMFYC